jgi:hypothetical protein
LPARGGAVGITERGTTKIADVRTNATTELNESGCALLSFPLEVSSIGGRLFQMSKLYSRWKFLSAILRFVPSVSSNTDGGLVVYYTQEPDDIYQAGEAVGAANASSAIDNIEFSVREKANIGLHLNPQLLYTTPSVSEASWHSAGVVNVISNGALANSKVYGSLYIDFVAIFQQPCAPFDVYSPLVTLPGKRPTGTGATGPGVSGGNIFAWSSDAPDHTAASGNMWLMDPNTGKNNLLGRIYIPPNSSMACTLIMKNIGTPASAPAPIGWNTSVDVVALDQRQLVSNDAGTMTLSVIFTNKTALPGWVRFASIGAGWNIDDYLLNLSTVPYTLGTI